MQRLRRASMKNSFLNNSSGEGRKTFKSYVNHFKEEEDDSESTTEDSPVKGKQQQEQQQLQPSSQSTETSPSSFTSYYDEKAFSSIYLDEKDTPSHGHGPRSFIASSAATLSRLTLSPSTKSSFTLPSEEDGYDLNTSFLMGTSRRQSFNCWTDFRDDESIITRPVDSVKRYNLHIKRSKGTIGQLFLSNRRLKFIDYHQEIQLDLDRRRSLNESTLAESKANLSLLRLPPFDIHPVSEENREIHEQDIDLMNIYQVRIEQEGQDTHLTVFCNDFRSIEFQMKSNDLVKSLIDKLEQLITVLQAASAFVPASPSSSRNTPEKALLWTMLAHQYSYNYPQDWNKLEGYWLASNPALRVAHCNENHDMCPSLPVSFISLSQYLSDITLIHTISPHLNGNRVPVVTYCHKSQVKAASKQRQNLLLRSSSFKIDVTNVLYNAIRPLNVVEVNNLLPPLSKLESAYFNLRKSCCLYADKFPHFLSQTGKWLKIVARVLSVVKEMTTILEEESSLLIIEENDDHFNPILSALLQIVLDEKRRTITGFESLISKEFIFLNGMVHKMVVRSPDIVLFTLFLDVVWQLICQNPHHFEFSSLYLIRLYDLQTIPWRKDDPASTLSLNDFQPTGSSPSANTATTTTASTVTDTNITTTTTTTTSTATLSTTIPGSIANLNLNQLMFIYNPLYGAASSTAVSNNGHPYERDMKIDCDLFLLKLWRPLYLRWLPLENHRQYYNYFSIPEFVYFDFLLNQFEGLKPVSKVDSSGEEMIESYL